MRLTKNKVCTYHLELSHEEIVTVLAALGCTDHKQLQDSYFLRLEDADTASGRLIRSVGLHALWEHVGTLFLDILKVVANE